MELSKIIHRIQGEAHVYEKIQETCATGLHSQHKSLQKSLQKLLAYFISDQKIPSQYTNSHHITYLGQNKVGIILARPIEIESMRCHDATRTYQSFVQQCNPLEIIVKSYLKEE